MKVYSAYGRWYSPVTHLLPITIAPGPLPVQHFPHDNSQAVDIRFVRESLSLERLGRAVAHCPTELEESGHVGVGVETTEPKVAGLDRPISRHLGGELRRAGSGGTKKFMLLMSRWRICGSLLCNISIPRTISTENRRTSFQPKSSLVSDSKS